MTLLTLDHVALATPDGRPLFSGLSLSLDDGRTGLVGRNGSGKSSLLHAIAKGTPPAQGTIRTGGRVALLRQLSPGDSLRVADALGIGEAMARLQRIEAGTASDEDHDRADWALGARVEARLAEFGLPDDILGRRVGTLSGGERTRVSLLGLLLGEPDLILLDEPTNNLDAEGRAAIAALLDGWSGGALVASHDRALLERMDRIVELTPVGCTIFTGGWSAFAAAREAARSRAADELDRSERELRQAERARQAEREKQARRDRTGKAAAAKGIDPKILLGAQKRRAEVTAGRYRQQGDALVDAARAARAGAARAVEVVTPLRFDLPPSGLPTQHRLVEARGLSLAFGNRRLFGPLDFTITGPERIALSGPNGAGKSSLIRLLLGALQPTSGTVRVMTGRIALLDQHLALLDPPPGAAGDMLAAMQRLNPGMSGHDAHAALAAAGFRNTWAARETASLSGGERMRLALACLFAGASPPQLLLLDEPTNHLDLEATELLEAALCAYDGAILCVSHDPAFRQAIGLDRTIAL